MVSIHQVNIVAQPVPGLSSETIKRIKDKASQSAPQDQLTNATAMRVRSDAARNAAAKSSGFLHPGGYAGAIWLVLVALALHTYNAGGLL